MATQCGRARTSLRLLAGLALLAGSACSRPASASSPAIRLVAAHPAGDTAYVEVTGIASDVTRDAGRLAPDAPAWARLLAVRAVADDGRTAGAAVAGRYAVVSGTLRFTPLFPFDPGRRYDVRYNASALAAAPGAVALQATVALPTPPPPAPTRVTEVFPSGEVVPENQLRMYIHFSGPMGRRGGLEHVRLLDGRGRVVVDPFLLLDAELWNADRTRFTLLFDPGRQKHGILPNRQMGPSLVAGRRYTLVIDEAWSDGHGRPLAQRFTRAFRVGPPARQALDMASWRIDPAVEGSRDSLVVSFPRPLDRALLLTALGVRREGVAVVGDVRVEAAETRWVLTPHAPWRPGRYELVALSILEDPAGNRLGRAFEVDPHARPAEQAEPSERVRPFTLAPLPARDVTQARR